MPAREVKLRNYVHYFFVFSSLREGWEQIPLRIQLKCCNKARENRLPDIESVANKESERWLEFAQQLKLSCS